MWLWQPIPSAVESGTTAVTVAPPQPVTPHQFLGRRAIAHEVPFLFAGAAALPPWTPLVYPDRLPGRAAMAHTFQAWAGPIAAPVVAPQPTVPALPRARAALAHAIQAWTGVVAPTVVAPAPLSPPLPRGRSSVAHRLQAWAGGPPVASGPPPVPYAAYSKGVREVRDDLACAAVTGPDVREAGDEIFVMILEVTHG